MQARPTAPETGLLKKLSTLQAFDGRDDTYWFSRDGRSLADRMANHVWLEYCLPAQAGGTTLVAYTLTAASGCPENDPMHVVLHGVRMCCELMSMYALPQYTAQWQSTEHACRLCFIASNLEQLTVTEKG